MTIATVSTNHANDPEQEWIIGIRAGEPHAFEALMRRYNRRLYRVARSILKDDAEAEDALQEAYWRAYRAMGDFHAEASLSTWLTRIVINESLGRLRRMKRNAEVIRSDELMVRDIMHGKISPFNFNDSENGPDALVWRAEIRALIEQKLDALSDDYRTIFILRAVEELPAVEVAEVLEIPEATVRSRFFRARRLMREALVHEIDEHAKDAFSFDGERCDRIVAGLLVRLKQQG